MMEDWQMWFMLLPFIFLGVFWLIVSVWAVIKDCLDGTLFERHVKR